MFFKETISALMVMATCQCYGYAGSSLKDSSTITISLQNSSSKLSKIDSVFIVIDRYDLRGAGVIKQVFYPDGDNRIVIRLPKGKYFMNIYCLGIYNKEAFERIISAKQNRNRKVSLRLQQSALFQLGLARMPDDHFDPSHLAIFNSGKK